MRRASGSCNGAEVTSVVIEHDRVSRVTTPRGDFSAAGYIVAAGAWSGAIPGLDNLVTRIFPVRGQMLLFKLAPGLLPCIVLRNGAYLIPRKDGHVLAGSTLEWCGFDKSTTDTARRDLQAFAADILPTLTARSGADQALERIAPRFAGQHSAGRGASRLCQSVHQQRTFSLWRDHGAGFGDAAGGSGRAGIAGDSRRTVCQICDRGARGVCMLIWRRIERMCGSDPDRDNFWNGSLNPHVFYVLIHPPAQFGQST
jgi:hypothetical protein